MKTKHLTSDEQGFSQPYCHDDCQLTCTLLTTVLTEMHSGLPTHTVEQLQTKQPKISHLK